MHIISLVPQFPIPPHSPRGIVSSGVLPDEHPPAFVITVQTARSPVTWAPPPEQLGCEAHPQTLIAFVCSLKINSKKSSLVLFLFLILMLACLLYLSSLIHFLVPFCLIAYKTPFRMIVQWWCFAGWVMIWARKETAVLWRGFLGRAGTTMIYVFSPLMPFLRIALALASSFSGSRCCREGRSWLV